MLTANSAIIFDMDGVIFDSEKVYYDAFWVAADIHEVEASDEFVHAFEGKAFSACEAILQQFLDNDVQKTYAFFEDWGIARQQILLEQGLEFKAGFLRLFEAIQATGRDIGLVTSSSFEDMKANFERSDTIYLDDFTHIVTLDDVHYPKPHPQPYQMMMRQLGKAPEECLVIEDSIPGISAALAAGARTIMLNEYVEPPSELDKQLIFRADHHDEIRDFLTNNGL